jgi:hypothetical protein
MSLTLGTEALDIITYVVSGAMAASKLLTAVQPLWSKLPRWLAVAAPVLVLDLPQVAQAVAGATTGTSLLTAVVTSLALLLPGLAEAEATPASSAPTKS